MLSIVTPPNELPVSEDGLRAHLWNIFDGHDSDPLFLDLLESATARAETILGRKLITQTWRKTVSGAGTGIILPFGNCQSVSSGAWFDGTSWTVIPLSNIYADTTTILASVDIDWTGIDQSAVKQTRIDWICGYGDADAVPSDIKMAIKQLASHWYRLRAATTLDDDEGIAKPVPFAFTALLESHRLNFLG